METILSELGHYGLAGVLVAVLVLFMWLRETRTLPKIIDTFRAEIAEERALFRKELAAERQVCERRHRQVLDAVADARECDLDAHKETRHKIANVQQELTLARALSQAEQGKKKEAPPP